MPSRKEQFSGAMLVSRRMYIYSLYNRISYHYYHYDLQACIFINRYSFIFLISHVCFLAIQYWTHWVDLSCIEDSETASQKHPKCPTWKVDKTTVESGETITISPDFNGWVYHTIPKVKPSYLWIMSFGHPGLMSMPTFHLNTLFVGFCFNP